VRELEQLRRIANQVGVVTFAAAGDVSRNWDGLLNGNRPQFVIRL